MFRAEPSLLLVCWILLLPNVSIAGGERNRITNAEAEPQNWLSHGRTYGEQRYSPLAQTNIETVARLGLVWAADMETIRGLEATPLIVDGVLYTSGSWGIVMAFDARSGKRLWKYDPQVRGYFSAYDADSGEMLWRFYTVPASNDGPHENPALEKAAATWSKDTPWEAGGGGTVWDSMSYDPELDLLYVGVGNGSPWGREIRSPGGGDNLYLSSILAVDPDDGRLVWHYQTTPGESWDYTATQHILLTDKQSSLIWQSETTRFPSPCPRLAMNSRWRTEWTFTIPIALVVTEQWQSASICCRICVSRLTGPVMSFLTSCSMACSSTTAWRDTRIC